MNLQNRFPAADIRQADIDLAVKSARTQQSIVQNIGAVGGSHHNDALVGPETVHLHQQLVQSLLALIMSAAKTAAALPSYGIDLINEDDCRSGLFRLFKQITHTSGADTDVEFYKVGARDRQELNACFTRNRFCQQSFTGSRRPDQKNTLRDSGSHGRISLRILQEVNDLRQFFFFFIAAGDIGEGFPVLLITAKARPRFAEARHAAGSAAHAVHHDIPQGHRAAHQDNIRDDAGPPGNDKAFAVVIGLQNTALMLVHDHLVEVRIEYIEAVEIIGLLFRILRVIRANLKNNLIAFRGKGLHLL